MSAPVGLVLLAASFGPFVVGQVELGTPALDSMGGTLDPVFGLGSGDFLIPGMNDAVTATSVIEFFKRLLAHDALGDKNVTRETSQSGGQGE